MLVVKLPKDKWLIIVIVVIILYTAIFSYLSILRYKSFFSYEWEDQATHHQLVWNTAHGNWFYNSIGISGYYFSYHFQPIILFQAIFYRIWPHIYIFFFIISFTLALGALPLYLIARKIFGNSASAFIISLSYLLYTPLHNVNFCDGDPVIFVIPLFLFILFILEKNSFCFNRRSLSAFLTCILLTLMCKEHIVFTTILLGIYLILRKKTKWGMLCFICSFVWLILSMPITLWLNKGQSLARSIDYGSFQELILLPFNRPADFLYTFFSVSHLKYLFKIIMPLSFLPLFSAVTYVSVADFLLLLLGKGRVEYCQVYYIAPTIPFLFIGLVYAIKKISNLFSTKPQFKDSNSRIIVAMSLLVFFLNILNLFWDNILGEVKDGKIIYDKRFININNIFNPAFYTVDEEDKLARSFISMIPPNSSVSASGDLLVALSSRKKLLELFNNDYDYLDAEYILFHTRYMGFGGGDYCKADENFTSQLIRKMKLDHHWMKLKEEGNFILFKRQDNWEKN